VRKLIRKAAAPARVAVALYRELALSALTLLRPSR
jgi:hypothetical protein